MARIRITRRRVLKSLAGGVVASLGAFGWATEIEPHWLEFTEEIMPLRGLPSALVGKRLVQVSDLHVGKTSVSYLIESLRKVEALRPDLLVMTGDFADHDYPHAERDIARVLAALPAASLGTFACLGNHDYRGPLAWRNVGFADRVATTATHAGVRVLRDETVDVAGLTLVGLDDLWSPRFEGERILASVSRERDAICLSHNPDSCDREIWSDFRGTILSGHTHGGQCKPPFLPPPFLPVSNRSHVAGWYELSPTRRLYVNRGLGHTMKARFNCRPEITCFTLAHA